MTLSRRLVVAWADAGPGSKVSRGWEPSHVCPGLDQDLFGSSTADAGNLIQPLQGELERAHALGDLLVEAGNLGFH